MPLDLSDLQPIDFGSIEETGGSDVKIGKGYDGIIEKLTYRPAKSAGKFASVSVEITGTGAIEGAKTWANLSLSPRAVGHRKFGLFAFFRLFGIDFRELGRQWPTVDDIDPESGMVLDPNLAGEPVMFDVSDNSSDEYPDSTQTSVTAWLGGKPKAQGAAANRPATAPTRPVANRPATAGRPGGRPA